MGGLSSVYVHLCICEYLQAKPVNGQSRPYRAATRPVAAAFRAHHGAPLRGSDFYVEVIGEKVYLFVGGTAGTFVAVAAKFLLTLFVV